MLTNEAPPPIPKKVHSPRTIASSVLGVISIISASMGLITTILMKDDMKVVSGGGGWVFGFFLFVIPLMLLSFALSMIGISLSSGTLKGRWLNLSGLMLSSSPILMVIIIMKIQNWQRETHDKQNYSYVDEVKFNKEKKELIKYPKNKKESNYTIPKSVTRIKAAAFTGCSSLTNMEIPDSVATIENFAFQSSKSLMSVTIGDGIMKIGDGVFQNCGNLKTVVFLGDAPKVGKNTFRIWGGDPKVATVTIYRKPEAKGWGDTFAGRPVKLISEKPINP